MGSVGPLRWLPKRKRPAGDLLTYAEFEYKCAAARREALRDPHGE
jgi:hypothetical protein